MKDRNFYSDHLSYLYHIIIISYHIIIISYLVISYHIISNHNHIMIISYHFISNHGMIIIIIIMTIIIIIITLLFLLLPALFLVFGRDNRPSCTLPLPILIDRTYHIPMYIFQYHRPHRL